MSIAEQATTDPDTDERDSYVANLRALADFFEANTEVPVPLHVGPVLLYVFGEDFPRVAAALGGDRVKSADANYFNVTRTIGDVEVVVYTSRDAVCERRVIGTEKAMVPDPAAPLVEVEREIVEWVCPDTILDRRERGLAGVADLRAAAQEARSA